MNKTFGVLFSILVCAIIFYTGVNKSISQVADINVTVNKTISDTLTVSDIIDVLVSFAHEGWTLTGNTGSSRQFCETITKVGENSVEILNNIDYHFLKDESKGRYYQTFKVEGPSLKFSAIIDVDANPGESAIHSWKIEIEVISKTRVKIKGSHYWQYGNPEKTDYFSGEYIKK
jgi:Na+-transporting NADH:ubiquinone oxidoreductase subunit NqrF